MTSENIRLWDRFKNYLWFSRELKIAIDISRINFTPDLFERMQDHIDRAYDSMEALEAGKIANPDEKRMVGHYWLRNPDIAPTTEIRSAISSALLSIKTFTEGVHTGKIAPKSGERFKHVLLIGIGGSALGPQFVDKALRTSKDPLDLYCFDNTDPDGMDAVLSEIPDLSKTLCIVISKSGGTKETRNGQLVAKELFQSNGLGVDRHFIAVTSEGSELDKLAVKEGWLARFPMWDWVGGRTSELSAVGLLPAALQGFNITEMLAGAAEIDNQSRSRDTLNNPAMLLALMWFSVGNGRGSRDMVILPYKDRIELLSRYLQQLVMESLGKERDLDGRLVNQGLAVYGNKGSTDQHAYVQQLRDGLNNFFAVFIEVLKDRKGFIRDYEAKSKVDISRFEVESGIRSGDYLSGFLQGTRRALYEGGRESITITVETVNERVIGQLIALFEKAVGFYASLINVNAYHQPGVEAGKKAAQNVIDIQRRIVNFISKSNIPLSVTEIADKISLVDEVETVFKVLRYLAANERVSVVEGKTVLEDRYGAM